MNQSATRYTGTAIALHWLMALAIVGNFCLGWYMSDLPFSMMRLKLFNYHKWAGATILFLASPENTVTRSAIVPVYGKF